MKKRKLLFCFCILLAMLMMLLPADCLAEPEAEDDTDSSAELEEELKRLASETDFSSWQAYFDELKASNTAMSEYASVGEFIEYLALGEASIDTGVGIGFIKNLFLPKLRAALAELVTVIALSLLSGLCGIALGDDSGTKQVLMLIISGVSILALVAYFTSIAAEAVNTVSRIGNFCSLAAPVLLGLMTALGCAGTVKVMSPMLVLLSNSILVVLGKIVLPLLIAGGVVVAVNALSDKLKLSRTVKLIQNTVKWLLGLVTTVYIAATSIGGIAAGAADGVSIRTAKYAIDKLIPAVGGMVGSAVDAVIGGGIVLKNAAGVTAILILAGISLGPVLKLFAGMTALRISAAIAEPFSDNRITQLLDGTADIVSYLFAAVCAACSLLLISIMIIIATGNTLIG